MLSRVAVISILLLLIMACSGPEPTWIPEPTWTPLGLELTPTPTTHPTSLAITSSIEAYPEVLDAATSKSGNSVSLVLIVRSATNTTRARELGDNFVRMYKGLSDDDPPGRSIGRGKYDYVIGVYYPNERPVAVGAKARGSTQISW